MLMKRIRRYLLGKTKYYSTSERITFSRIASIFAFVQDQGGTSTRGESVTHFNGLEIEETWLICSEEEVKRSEFLVRISQVVSESQVFGRRIESSPLLPEKIQPKGRDCSVHCNENTDESSKSQV